LTSQRPLEMLLLFLTLYARMSRVAQFVESWGTPPEDLCDPGISFRQRRTTGGYRKANLRLRCSYSVRRCPTIICETLR